MSAFPCVFLFYVQARWSCLYGPSQQISNTLAINSWFINNTLLQLWRAGPFFHTSLIWWHSSVVIAHFNKCYVLSFFLFFFWLSGDEITSQNENTITIFIFAIFAAYESEHVSSEFLKEQASLVQFWCLPVSIQITKALYADRSIIL